MLLVSIWKGHILELDIEVNRQSLHVNVAHSNFPAFQLQVEHKFPSSESVFIMILYWKQLWLLHFPSNVRWKMSYVEDTTSSGIQIPTQLWKGYGLW